MVQLPARRQARPTTAPVSSVASNSRHGTPEAVVSHPLGNSGDPESPHFDDALEGWVEGTYRPLPFRRSDVEARMESRTVLSP